MKKTKRRKSKEIKRTSTKKILDKAVWKQKTIFVSFPVGMKW